MCVLGGFDVIRSFLGGVGIRSCKSRYPVKKAPLQGAKFITGDGSQWSGSRKSGRVGDSYSDSRTVELLLEAENRLHVIAVSRSPKCNGEEAVRSAR